MCKEISRRKISLGAGPLSNFFPSLSIALMVKMSSKTMFETVADIATEDEEKRDGPDQVRSGRCFLRSTLMLLRRAAVRQIRALSSLTLRVPPDNTPRESPTPLVFVSSGSWDEGSLRG